MRSTPRPPVMALTRAATSSLVRFTTSCAPSARANAAFSALLTTPIDREAPGARQVDERVAHAARGGIDEDAVAFPHARRVAQQVIAHLVVGERRRRLEIDAVGQHEGRLGRGRDIFGVMAAAMRPLARRGNDMLADLALADAGSDALDDAGQLGAGRGRQRRHPVVGPGADQRVGNADADRMRPHQHLARLGLRHRPLDAAQHAGRARGLEHDLLHGLPFLAVFACASVARYRTPRVRETAMPRDSERERGRGGGQQARNVLGMPLENCSTKPMTGFFRNGCCDTSPQDVGSHTVCILASAEFLDFSKSSGNDLSTPIPAYSFPGVKPGDRWCLCAPRWQEALEAGRAPRVVLRATHEGALQHCSLADLKRFAIDLS